MKKLILILLAVMLLISMAACDSQPSTQPTTTAPVTTLAPTKTEPPTTTHPHEYNCEQVKDATCSMAGLLIYRCNCGASYEEEIPTLEHAWADWFIDTPATMTETGVGKRMCTMCSTSETKELEKLSLEEALMDYGRMVNNLPYFTDATQLTVKEIFDWVRYNVGYYSSDWNEQTFQVTNVYALNDFDTFTTANLGTAYDFKSMATPDSEFTYDEANNHLIWKTYGAGGGWYEYISESYTQQNDTTYTVRYAAKNYDTGNVDYYGKLVLELVDGHLVIRSHAKER